MSIGHIILMTYWFGVYMGIAMFPRGDEDCSSSVPGAVFITAAQELSRAAIAAVAHVSLIHLIIPEPTIIGEMLLLAFLELASWSFATDRPSFTSVPMTVAAIVVLEDVANANNSACCSVAILMLVDTIRTATAVWVHR